MRRNLIFIAALALALPAFAGGGHDHWDKHRGLSVSMDDDYGDITDCNQIRVTYDGRVVPPLKRTPSARATPEPSRRQTIADARDRVARLEAERSHDMTPTASPTSAAWASSPRNRGTACSRSISRAPS